MCPIVIVLLTRDVASILIVALSLSTSIQYMHTGEASHRTKSSCQII